MKKPVFKTWANAVTLWYEHSTASEARRQALMKNDLDAMNRLAELADPIANEIGELSVQITALEAKRDTLSSLYKDLEKQFNEHSDSYDKHQNN